MERRGGDEVASAIDWVELTRSLEPREVVAAVTRLAASVLHDWAVLDLWRPDGSLERVGGTHVDPAMQPFLDRYCALPRLSGRPASVRSLAETVAVTGEVATGTLDPVVLAANATTVEQAELVRTLATSAYVIVPVTVGSRRLGALAVMRSAGSPPFSAGERALAEQVAERAAIALANALDYDEQRSAALILQHHLLGTAVPAVPGATIATRYRAGGRGAEVGGDWYDAFPLDGGALGVVVGDVQGHDVTAAAVMGQIRSVVHSHAREGLPPAQVVEHANRFLLEAGADRLVTLAYLQLFPAEQLVMWVRAGHLPAVVASPEGVVILEGRPGLPLGVAAGTRWTEDTTHLPADSMLAVFTDGLIESSGRSFDEGLALLTGLVGQARRSDDLEAVADVVLEGMADPSHDGDDLAMVLLRLDAPPADGPGRSVVRRLPAASRSAPIARRFVTDLLPQWGVDDDTVELAALLVTELITNATRHSDGEIELRLRLTEVLHVAVFDDSHRLPSLQSPGTWEPSGRGLQLVEALARRWGVDLEEGGKRVWFEL